MSTVILIHEYVPAWLWTTGPVFQWSTVPLYQCCYLDSMCPRGRKPPIQWYTVSVYQWSWSYVLAWPWTIDPEIYRSSVPVMNHWSSVLMVYCSSCILFQWSTVPLIYCSSVPVIQILSTCVAMNHWSSVPVIYRSSVPAWTWPSVPVWSWTTDLVVIYCFSNILFQCTGDPDYMLYVHCTRMAINHWPSVPGIYRSSVPVILILCTRLSVNHLSHVL